MFKKSVLFILLFCLTGSVVAQDIDFEQYVRTPKIRDNGIFGHTNMNRHKLFGQEFRIIAFELEHTYFNKGDDSTYQQVRKIFWSEARRHDQLKYNINLGFWARREKWEKSMIDLTSPYPRMQNTKQRAILLMPHRGTNIDPKNGRAVVVGVVNYTTNRVHWYVFTELAGAGGRPDTYHHVDSGSFKVWDYNKREHKVINFDPKSSLIKYPDPDYHLHAKSLKINKIPHKSGLIWKLKVGETTNGYGVKTPFYLMMNIGYAKHMEFVEGIYMKDEVPYKAPNVGNNSTLAVMPDLRYKSSAPRRAYIWFSLPPEAYQK